MLHECTFIWCSRHYHYFNNTKVHIILISCANYAWLIPNSSAIGDYKSPLLTRGPSYLHGLNLMAARINNFILYEEMASEITRNRASILWSRSNKCKCYLPGHCTPILEYANEFQIITFFYHEILYIYMLPTIFLIMTAWCFCIWAVINETFPGISLWSQHEF